MKDDFDERLTRRLRAMDAAVPRPMIKEGVMSGTRSTHITSRFPLGLVAGVVTVAVVVAVASMALRTSSNVGANESTAPTGSAVNQSQPVASSSLVATPTATASSPASGIVITNVQAVPFAGSGNPVRVVATIQNQTGADDKLIGASSPSATSGGLYATSGGMPASTDASGMGNLRPMPWWLLTSGQTIQLRPGDGEIVLNGLAAPLTPGDHIQVTFIFANAAPVTVSVPVVASGS
jgi:copper(I)-binding protein